MGWQFVLAEVLGAFALITMMWVLIRLFLPKNLETEMRTRAQEKVHGSLYCNHEDSTLYRSGGVGEQEHEHERRWTGVARAFVMDWSMLWKEILGGFLIAGFLATLMPHRWWKGNVIPPKRTGSLSDDRQCARRPDYRHALVRLFGR